MRAVTFFRIAELEDGRKAALFCRKYKILPCEKCKDSKYMSELSLSENLLDNILAVISKNGKTNEGVS